MREEEFVCLKALAFLHPEAKGLSIHAQVLVRETRNKILKGSNGFLPVNIFFFSSLFDNCGVEFLRRGTDEIRKHFIAGSSPESTHPTSDREHDSH